MFGMPINLFYNFTKISNYIPTSWEYPVQDGKMQVVLYFICPTIFSFL